MILRRFLRSLSLQDVFGKGWDLSLLGGGSATSSGERVTADTATRLTTVYACVRLIAETIAMLPVGVFAEGDETRDELPKPPWMRQPNQEDTWQETVDMVLSCALLGGDGLAHIQARDTDGLPAELKAVHPADLMEPRLEEGTGRVYWTLPSGRRLYKYRPDIGDGDLIQLKAWPDPRYLRGISPIEKAAEAIGLGLAAQRFGAGFYGSGQTVSGVIEHPGKWDDGFARAVRDGWVKEHSGASRSHLPAILTGGATWKPLAVPPDQAQFIETRRFQVEEIARFYRVAPFMVGAVEKSTSWGAGIEEQGIGYLTYTLLPWIIRAEQAFGQILPAGQQLKWRVQGLLRGSQKTRIAAYTAGRNGGWLSVNDIRELEDMTPVEGGGDYMAPLNSAQKANEQVAEGVG